MPRAVELTADVGELEGPAGRRHDEGLIGLLTTAHIACGGHAGDPDSMASSIESCLVHGVRVGAHPSYPDLEGFGRRSMGLRPEEVAASVADQLAVLAEVAGRAGASVVSAKPHGQLYHDLSADPGLAEVVLAGIASAGVAEVVLAAGSPAADLARSLGLLVAAEGFCDRRYDAEGRLVARTDPGALLVDPAEAVAQALDLVRGGVSAIDGVHAVTSLCVHSDSPGAPAILAAVRAALDEAADVVVLGR